MSKKISLGVLASGSGTNLQAIIDNVKSGKIDAEIEIVISDKANAYAIKRAEAAGINTAIIVRSGFNTKSEFEMAMVEKLHEAGVEIVCLAGFMRILSPTFLRAFPNKIINIHPALLPSFPGLHAQKQAFDSGVKVSGCTVHFVDEGTDTGPIIMQKAVSVEEGDTEETLADRILEQEHKIYSQAIDLYAKGRLEIRGRSVVIKKIDK